MTLDAVHTPGRLAALVAAAVALAPAAVAQEVRVGAIADLTGAYSEVGRQIQASQMLAARVVNDQGGLFEDATTLVLEEGDGGCAPEPAVASTRRLLADPEIVSVIGPTCSGATMAMAREVAIPAGRVVLSHSATSPLLTSLEDDDLVFRMAPSDSYLAIALSGMVHDRYIRRVAVTHAPDDYNAQVAKAFIESYEDAGGTITIVEEHSEDSDFAALADRMNAPATEALMVFAYYNATGRQVIEAALARGGVDIFVGADGMIDDSLIEQVGPPNLDQALFMIAAADDTSPAYRAYAEIAGQNGLDASVPFTPHGFDAAFVTALAIEWMGEADPARMPEALREVGNAPGVPILPGEWSKAKALLAEGREIDYQGGSGAVEFDANGDTLGLFSVNTVRRDGKWNVDLLRY